MKTCRSSCQKCNWAGESGGAVAVYGLRYLRNSGEGNAEVGGGLLSSVNKG